jgi:hypothetical protein
MTERTPLAESKCRPNVPAGCMEDFLRTDRVECWPRLHALCGDLQEYHQTYQMLAAGLITISMTRTLSTS